MFDVKNKKITVMGLGLLGRGLGDVKFLAKQGAKLIVTDLKTEKMLAQSVKQIKNLPNVKLVLGKHRLLDFKNKDYILKAAGVPLNSPFIKTAKNNKIPVKMDESWFANYCPCPIIGITGTRGKTTTSHLIYELVKNLKKSFLAGNVVGVATLPLIKKVKENNLVVLELSSWQLQGWHDEKISPHIAVITNIYPDHMNYYKTMDKYVNDKKSIYQYQSSKDYLILNKNNPYSKQFAKEAKSKVIWFSVQDVPKNWQLKIKGQHNLENVAASLKVAKILKISQPQVKKVIENFKGVEGRLEFVRQYKGINFYNDTTATTPEAVMAALNSFPGENIVLLAGGSDKRIKYSQLAKLIKQKVKAVILLEGMATQKLVSQLKKVKFDKTMVFADSLREAFKQAKYILQPGDVFLFSPGATSFGLFINEYDRGEQFKKMVNNFK